MSLPLTGRTVALAEGRQLEELAQMLEKEGATTVRCPLVSILDAPDEAPVLAWLRQLAAGQFDYVVFFTGEGASRLMGFADRAGWRDDVLAALRQTRIVSRGPKPVRVLKELGLTAYKIAKEPTTDGIIAALKAEDLTGKTVGVQFFAPTNPALEEFLPTTGAKVSIVLPYVYAPSADGERVADLILRMTQGAIDALVFTSSPQIDRLYEIAAQRHLEAELAAGLSRTQVAAVGPIVAETLRQHGAPVDICPEQGFVMKNLVKHIKTALTSGNPPG